ncbi:DUF6133 family protein [Tissierella praeacuta]|uniref:DUF6133 family protein n=1 Tax=Tissierella praeacuta TaxID=43131 RepID=UPI0028A78494|nr:DUF6133 family protein [Tissierella praeacuta]
MIKKFKERGNTKCIEIYTKISTKLKDKTGVSEYVDTGIKILIGVVIGALLLAGLYKLFSDTILPTLNDRIKDMFNYKG